jgi:hypothetical protein
LLTEHGRDVVITFVKALRAIAFKVMMALDDPEIKPAAWHEVVSAINVLGQHISPDAIAKAAGQSSGSTLPPTA